MSTITSVCRAGNIIYHAVMPYVVGKGPVDLLQLRQQCSRVCLYHILEGEQHGVLLEVGIPIQLYVCVCVNVCVCVCVCVVKIVEEPCLKAVSSSYPLAPLLSLKSTRH